MADADLPILIVDDYTNMRRMLRNMLRQIGYGNIEEDDGPNAWTHLVNRPYRLVLSDWLMEPISGIDLLTAMRATPKLQSIPFIMLTGVSSVDFVKRARGAGAQDYLVKPFSTEALRKKVAGAIAGSDAEQIIRMWNDYPAPHAMPVLVGGDPLPPAAEPASPKAGPGDAADRVRRLTEDVQAVLATLPPGEERAQSDAQQRELETLRTILEKLLAATARPAANGLDGPRAQLINGVRSLGARAVKHTVQQPFRRLVEAGLSGALGTTDDDPASMKERAEAARRRHKRFIEPVLLVNVRDVTYETVDWSIGGMALGRYEGSLEAGDRVKISFHAAADGQVYRTTADVVRVDRKTRTLILSFSTASSATLELLGRLSKERRTVVALDDDAQPAA